MENQPLGAPMLQMQSSWKMEINRETSSGISGIVERMKSL